ncbi:MAG: hypothetical protein AAF467_17310 [Actinomycetota bacterium]
MADTDPLEGGGAGVDHVIAEVAAEVTASAKYRNIDADFVLATATDLHRQGLTRKTAVKEAKRRLHQVYGAFVASTLARTVDQCVAAIDDGSDVKEACRAAMARHRSTQLRLDSLPDVYDQIAQWCGRPSSVLDIGCGLNPLAIPWMQLRPEAHYRACDIDGEAVAAIQRLGPAFGVTIEGFVYDAARPQPLQPADLVLALLLAPTIDAQRPGATGALLRAVDAPVVVASMPLATLSGRRTYQRDNEALFRAAADGSRYVVADQAVVGGEELVLLRRSEGDAPTEFPGR